MRVMLLVVFSFVALLLGGVVIITWLRSGKHLDEFSINGQRRYFVQSFRGRITLASRGGGSIATPTARSTSTSSTAPSARRIRRSSRRRTRTAGGSGTAGST